MVKARNNGGDSRNFKTYRIRAIEFDDSEFSPIIEIETSEAKRYKISAFQLQIDLETLGFFSLQEIKIINHLCVKVPFIAASRHCAPANELFEEL